MPVGPLRCNCSIFGDEQSREAIVVDPGGDISKIIAILEKHVLKVKAIVITHGHIDHVAAAAELKTLTQAPVYMNNHDQEQLDMRELQAKWVGIAVPGKVEIDTPAGDGTVLGLGSAHFQVMHTPGHTMGSLCLWIPEENKLVAGDTLFRDSIGRTDLPGGDSRQILTSIKTRLLDLPEDAVVIPGHGESTTIGRERAFNPFLQRL
jgi:glyoxylase-like metal-dependent hydrolase (beta-lactamase superfamily II)